MTHLPFGLSPQVFSIAIVAGWLIIGPLVAMLFTRNKRSRLLNTGSSRQQAAQLPPAYPALQPPTQPFADLVGLWHFKSAASWIGVVCGVVVGIGSLQLPLQAGIPLLAAALLVIFLSLARPTRAVRECNVDQNLAITFIRGGRDIPLDFNHYRYVRMHVSSPRYGNNFPSMLVFNRDSRPGVGALLSSMLFPRVDDRRIVLFYSKWWNADGAVIPITVLDDFFRDACRRAGYEPQFRKTWFASGTGGWEVRPD
jgi:hypothetical protein